MITAFFLIDLTSGNSYVGNITNAVTSVFFAERIEILARIIVCVLFNSFLYYPFPCMY
jgi:ammonia channel protein AmtB